MARVLLVDDDEHLLAIAIRLLTREDPSLELVATKSAPEALLKLTEEQFDVVVADYLMPKMDGLELLRRIRDGGSAIPFIMFTGQGREEVAMEALNLGADYYLMKDVGATTLYGELAHIIGQVLHHKQTEDALQEKTLWSQVFLDTLDCVALVLRSDRTVVASNQAGVETGAIPGQRCFATWGQRDDPCPWCRAPMALATGKAQHIVVEALGIVWDAHWIPLGNDLYLHYAFDITERRRMETKLQETDERLRNLLEVVPMSLSISNEEGDFLECNPAAWKIAGYDSKEDFQQVNAQEMWHNPKDREKHIKLIKQGPVREFEAKFRRKDGTIFWGSSSAVMQDTKDGPVLITAFQDISERKRAEDALQASEELYRTTIDSIDDIIHVIDANSRVILTNRSFRQYCKRLGFKTDVLGLSLSDAMPYLPKATLDEYHNVLATRQPYFTEETIVLSGKGFFTQTSKIPIFKNGSIAQIVTIIHDVTEITHARKELIEHRNELEHLVDERTTKLRKSEERFRLLAENAQDVISLVSYKPEFRYIYHSPAILRFTGYAPEEFYSDPTLGLKIVHPDDRPLLEELRENPVFDGKPVILRWIHKDGTIYWTEDRSTPVYDETGNLIAIEGVSRDITDQKKAEDALRQSEQEKALILHSTPEVIVYHDTNLIIKWANKAASDYTGLSAEEMVGQHCFEVWRHRKTPCDDCPVRDALASGEPQEREMATPDGKLWIERGYPVRSDEGEIIGVIEVATDITDRKLAEEALRKSNERFRLLAENAQDIIYRIETKPEFRYDYLSPAVEKIAGYTPEEYYQDPDLALKIVHPDDRPRLKDAREIPVFDGKPVILRWIHKDGTIRWTEDIGRPILDGAGNLVALEGVSRDVTEKKKAEDALTQSEYEKALILHSTPDVIVYQDTALKIKWVNKAASDYIGLPAEEMVGRYCFEVWRHQEAPCEDCPVRDSLSSGEPQERENMTPDGKIWIDRGYPVRSDGGEIIGAVEVATDITDRKQIEERLIESDKKYRILVEQSLMGLTIVLPDKMLFANQAFADILGYPLDALLEMTPEAMQRLMPPDDLKQAVSRLRDRFAGKKVSPRHQHRLIRKNGSIAWVETQTSLIHYEGQLAAQVVYVDITELKLMEKTFRESEERYRALSEAAFEGIAIHQNYKIMEANPQLAIMLGFETKELIGKPGIDLVAPEFRKAFFNYIQRQSDEIFGCLALRKDGTVFPAKIMARNTHFKGQSVQIAVFQDMTYEAVVEDQTELLCRYLPGGILTFVNDAYCRAFSKTRQELIGHHFLPLIPEEDQEMVERQIESLSVENPVITYEHRIISPTGELNWQQWTDRAVIDEQGRIVEYQATGRDVTERKQAELKLKDSEERWRLLFEYAPDGHYLYDLEGTLLDGNKAAEELTGFRKEELIGSNLLELKLMDEDQIPQAAEGLFLNVQGKPSGPYQFALNRKDGSKCHVEIRTYPVTIKDQTVVLGIARDISERKRAAKALQESEEQYRFLFEHAPIGIGMADIQGTIIANNQYMLEMLGYSEDELKMIDPVSLQVNPMSREQIFQKIQEAGRVRDYELQLRRKDGSVYDALINIDLTTIGEKQLLFTTARDITARKQSEEILKQQKKELSDFAHAMAHDLRNQLLSIEGYADTLQTEYDKTFARRIADLAEKMNAQLRRSVILADAGLIIDKTDEVDLGYLTREIAKNVIPDPINFVVDSLPIVLGDFEKLSQVFQNLFENAVTHGKPTQIEVRRHDSAGEINLLVINDGTPISLDHRPEILNQGFTTKEQGGGLGLAIVQKVINAHGWQIQLEDAPQTTFRIIIPLK
ncbi:MAG: PAS domain S-box protein [Candidatus Heimdallarchaeota archaeon]